MLLKIVDVERLECRFAETVANLGLMTADGFPVANIDHQLVTDTEQDRVSHGT